MSKNVLLVDDDREIIATMIDILKHEGYNTRGVNNGKEALAVLNDSLPDVLISDLEMPGMNGITLLEKAKSLYPQLPVMLVTGHGTIEVAVEAMQKGARDFILKPVRMKELLAKVENLTEISDLRRENADLKKELNSQNTFDNIIGRNAKLLELLKTVKQVSQTPSTVLIRGEMGTGKELIAKALHTYSNRSDKKMISVNCGVFADNLLESELFGHVKGAFTGAINDRMGRFEKAHKSTLFLDEIGDISPSMQVKLLRVLAEGTFERVGGEDTIQVDSRIIAATNKDLEAAMSDNSFRSDLFYRLNVISLHLPPLREREDDIPLLVTHFINKMARQFERNITGITDDAMQRLQAHKWPGNIRELQNACERAVTLCQEGKLDVEHFPPDSMSTSGTMRFTINGSGSLKEMVDNYERQLIMDALSKNDNNKLRTAKFLKVNRSTFMSKLDKLGLK